MQIRLEKLQMSVLNS